MRGRNLEVLVFLPSVSHQVQILSMYVGLSTDWRILYCYSGINYVRVTILLFQVQKNFIQPGGKYSSMSVTIMMHE